MPYCDGYRYCLTIIDRFSRWPEVVPLADQEAETVARALFDSWIARFGTPLRVTTDQGRQFESNLFKHLNRLTGTAHIRTTSYHPAANGMIERLHRQLKAAIRCHQDRWTESLPAVMLGIRSAWKEDLNATAAEMIYGQPLRLPGEFLASRTPQDQDADAADFVKHLRRQFQELRPAVITRHGEKKIFVFKDLTEAKHVFVRYDGPKQPLQQPYTGPFPVISRSDKSFVINIGGKNSTVTIDRLKPAYIISDDIDEPAREDADDDFTIAFPRLADPPNQLQPELPAPPRVNNPRPRRTVRFPDRFQAGFS